MQKMQLLLHTAPVRMWTRSAWPAMRASMPSGASASAAGAAGAGAAVTGATTGAAVGAASDMAR
jgi:hypothetical protein